MKKVIGLLVMAYGTPYKEEDLERYYTHIRRGRPPEEEALQELRERYNQIGGISPLASITLAQMNALSETLNVSQDTITFKPYLGLKHIEPFVEDAVQQMIADGITEAVTIVLAPHYSTYSVKSYNSRAVEAADGKIVFHHVNAWYTQPQFLDYWTQQLERVSQEIGQEAVQRTAVIISAHSLPERIIALGDPYPEQLLHTAKLLQKRTSIPNIFIGWQSAGRTPEPWIGPDVQDLTTTLFEQHRFERFVYVPLGFVSDHLEVLFDNDVECKNVTDSLGVFYVRPAMPNTHPTFIAGMCTAVLEVVESSLQHV
ncbi:MAG: ferrochelatase [Bacilli bacterium]